MAARPSQSPVADTTCTSHSRKNSGDPNSRTCQPGRSSGDSVRMASVCEPGRSSSLAGRSSSRSAARWPAWAARRGRRRRCGSPSDQGASSDGSGFRTAKAKTLDRRALLAGRSHRPAEDRATRQNGGSSSSAGSAAFGAAAFLAGAFFDAAFLLAAFLAAAFLLPAFLLGAFLAARFFLPPPAATRARRSDSSSAARSMVMVAGSSPDAQRGVALAVGHVGAEPAPRAR